MLPEIPIGALTGILGAFWISFFALDLGKALWGRAAKKQSFTQAVRACWEEEHLFLAGAGAGARRQAGEILLVAGVAVYTACMLLQFTTLYRAGWSGTPEQWVFRKHLLYDIAIVLMLLRMMGCVSYSWKQLLWAALALSPLLVSMNMGADHLQVLSFVMIISAKDIDPRRVLKTAVLVAAVMLALFALLALTGAIGMDGYGGDFTVDTRRARYGMGFSHPNDAGQFTAPLAWGWLLLRWHRMRWWDWAGLLLVAAYIQFLPNCRSAMGAILIAVALAAAFRAFPRFFSHPFWAVGFGAVPVGCAVFTLSAALFYNGQAKVWAKLNGLFSDRMRLLYDGMQLNGASVLGREIQRSESFYALDNACMSIFFTRGVVGFVLFVGALALLMAAFAKMRAFPEMAVLSGVCFQALMEQGCRWVQVNPAFWLLGGMLFLLPLARWGRFSRPIERLPAAAPAPPEPPEKEPLRPRRGKIKRAENNEGM